MSSPFSTRFLLASLPLVLCAVPAYGHISYNNRNFGAFTGLELQVVTITEQNVPNNWAWADGTDADFAHSHGLRFFRFTLEITSSVTISITSLDPAAMLPGFSIYSGLAHTPPAPADYETTLTTQYLTTLPGPAKEGAFNALGTWRMGNDASVTYDDFSTFTYMGNAADGSSANYGSAAGINGDGVADGIVTSTFTLGPGDYTLAVGGATYEGQVDGTLDQITASVTVVPEPTVGVLALGSSLSLGMIRRRRISGSNS